MSERIVLFGASGFVGRQLWRPLRDRGFEVRRVTRDVNGQDLEASSGHWIEADLEDLASLRSACDGCSIAFFLAHALGTGEDYPAREKRWAENFVAAAEASSLEHVVYLGAPEPAGAPSDHIASRLEVGRILRSSRIPTTELRASMVVGKGGGSWRIVYDLAERLSVLTFPDWMESRTQPVALDDAIFALAEAARIRPTESSFWNIPGPDLLTAREIVEIAGEEIRGERPVSVYFPDLVPDLTTQLFDVFVGDDDGVARELARGLTRDIIMSDRLFWDEISPRQLMSYRESVRAAIA